MAESEVMDVDWIEDLEVTTEQNGKSATELQIENELPIDRWIDIAYDENGDEIADDNAELLQAQESIRMEFTSIPAAQPDTNPHRRILKRELQAEALTACQKRSLLATFFDRLESPALPGTFRILDFTITAAPGRRIPLPYSTGISSCLFRRIHMFLPHPPSRLPPRYCAGLTPTNCLKALLK